MTTSLNGKAEIRPSSTSIGRGLGFERAVVIVVGFAAVLAGALALVVGAGRLGVYRARRPVLDPLLVQWWQANRQLAMVIAIVLGLVLVIVGLWWTARALRPESRPDMRLESGPDGNLTVASSALVDAVRADAETVTGVKRARARMAGNAENPNLRLTLSLHEGTNVRHVWEELDDKVLSRARAALETEVLPTAIRLELDRAPRQRVR
ncbi:alkaline shock response membrane anchor protein AmaP [Saccharopolyspora taberi]|uniref:Alkaline shock response membrane anchor protein AmaP n=1 Tax=Saccharopolyspora taberi TaxID=60895 RepID=A0ABN3VGI3_9PSEU